VLETFPGGISEEKASPANFGITVTSDGKTTPQPGPAFSEGDETGLTLAYLLSAPQPIRYPRWAVRQGWEGTLTVAVEILPDGKVGRWKVMKSTGYRILDQAAVKAVREWRFHPATEGEKPVLSCIQIPIRFRLSD
jgi:protein TonB